MCFFIFPLIPFIIRFYGDEDQNDANKYENKELKPLDSNVIGQDEENDGYELHEYTPKETSFLSSMCTFSDFKQIRLCE